MLLAALAMQGCVRLHVAAPEIRDYRLDYSAPKIDGTPVPVVLRIAPLSVAAIYDRQAIVYRDGPYSTGTYFDSRWSASPGSMVSDLLARDFADSALYRDVQEGPSIAAADYLLTGMVEDIEERATDRSCSGHLRLRVAVTRLQPGANSVVLQKSYDADEPTTCGQPTAVARAISQDLAKISAELQADVNRALSVAAAATAGGGSARAPRPGG